MTALLFNDNGSFKEVKAINWLYKNASECQDIYFDLSSGDLEITVLVSKYRTFKTSNLSINAAKELFEDSKFDRVAKHY